MKRSYNFSAGPAAIPTEVLEQASKGLLEFTKGVGVQEISHRSPEFIEIRDSVILRLKQLLNVSESYEVFLCPGGATMQFSLIPMNLLLKNKKCDYLETGIWSNKAAEHAKKLGDVHIVASSKSEGYCHIPKEWNIREDTSYLHLTSNNTVYGTQLHDYTVNQNVTLICDMSSDILSRKIDVNQFDMIYAGAQKNLGPSGVVIVIIKKELLERVDASIPDLFQFKKYVEYNSLYNTPPTFSFFMLDLVLKWIEKKGGVEYFDQLNHKKAQLIYDTIDQSEFYVTNVSKEDRSLMNVIFDLENKSLTEKFIVEAEKEDLVNLKGYRSVGGIRASIYNACTYEACEKLVAFMKSFENNNE
ncbi:MAG: 3-phosphoserine/phosphohydroxythreonine aminotransferase [Planctomycetota bacterium]|nr:MAG: 3-phosphoserine/phosphohydroxythreonine aminotransferase [Planctomycetota bacterium]